MRQRVTIAIALACGPKVLIADEPTTALDVTVQAQILDLLAEQQRERHMAMILVSHDLGVVAGRTDEIMVMYGGRVVEHARSRVHGHARQLDPHRHLIAVDDEESRLTDRVPNFLAAGYVTRNRLREINCPSHDASGIAIRRAYPGLVRRYDVEGKL